MASESERDVEQQVPENPSSDDSASDTEGQGTGNGKRFLSSQEIWNLTFCLLAWACTICNVTLVVGTSAVVVLSIGGSESTTSVPLGVFFFGASLVSVFGSPWIFEFYGRKKGFLSGIAFGFVGTALGAVSIAAESPPIFMISSAFFGMAMGIGFYLRFAAVEVVPPHWAARAVTLVVSGGCIAAFAGPESAQATKDLFGEDLIYMGVFLMTGIFNAANAIFTLLIQFPPSPATNEKPTRTSQSELFSLLRKREFIVPMLSMTIAWAAMAMPMSLVRVVLQQVGYSSRQSLTVIELHFLGMYAPGFFTGTLIHRYGPQRASWMSILIFGISIIFMMLSKSETDGSIATWIIGMILVGIAWNFGFTAGTVWLTRLYDESPAFKIPVQAANDALMFALSGAWIFSASYIYEAGGSELDGWKTLNLVVVGLLAFLAIVFGVNAFLDKRNESTSETNENTFANETTQHDNNV